MDNGYEVVGLYSEYERVYDSDEDANKLIVVSLLHNLNAMRRTNGQIDPPIDTRTCFLPNPLSAFACEMLCVKFAIQTFVHDYEHQKGLKFAVCLGNASQRLNDLCVAILHKKYDFKDMTPSEQGVLNELMAELASMCKKMPNVAIIKCFTGFSEVGSFFSKQLKVLIMDKFAAIKEAQPVEEFVY